MTAGGSIQTPRLTLRPIDHDDVGLLVRLDSDPEVMRLISGGRPSSVADVQAVVDRSIGHRWIANGRDSGDFIGWFSLRPSESARRERELGYRLRREHWGAGLATEGARAMLDLAFGELRALRVFAQTMQVNIASRRVMEKCGMRFVRHFRGEWPDPIPGDEHGDVEYELFASEWGPRPHVP